MKAKIVANGRTQDRSIYMDYYSPTVKTSSVMMCLKVAATKGWKFKKVDVREAFLMPEFKGYTRDDRRLVV